MPSSDLAFPTKISDIVDDLSPQFIHLWLWSLSYANLNGPDEDEFFWVYIAGSRGFI